MGLGKQLLILHGLGGQGAPRRSLRAALIATLLVGGTLLGVGTASAATIESSAVRASDISADGVTLTGTIDPEGTETSGEFVYAPQGAGLTSPAAKSAPATAVVLGAGHRDIPLQAHLQGLSPSTSYEFALKAIATNSPGETVESGSQLFTTQASGGAFALPDDRIWELVSPVNKHGAGLRPPDPEGGLIKAADSGDAITYISSAPPVESVEGNRALELNQNLATRADGVWSTRDITTPNGDLGRFIFGDTSEYKDFAEDLSTALVEPPGEAPIPPLAEGAERTIYLRNNLTNAYQPLVTAAMVGEGHQFGQPENHLGTRGGSADLSHVVFSSKEALTSEVLANHELENLYEWSSEGVELVSVLPNGHPASEPGEGIEPEISELGFENRLTRNAISSAASADGTRVMWQTTGINRHLFLRDMTTHETVKLDEPNAGLAPQVESPDPRFQGASSDGSRVFFTDVQRLTADSNAESGQPDLYVAEVEGGAHLSVTVKDISKVTVGEQRANVRGLILGSDAEANDVFYVANGQLAPGTEEGDCAGEGGECTLYVGRLVEGEWQNSKIAVLGGEDGSDWGNPSGTLTTSTARVSANGHYLAFMSQLPLTGYDNRDVTSGAADQEVFLFDATNGRLRCASCNPSGARPQGVADPAQGTSLQSLLVDGEKIWQGKSLAGNILPWSPVALDETPYQPRYLSNEGRLFFDAADDLVAADTNHREDVYQYEPEGIAAGSCGTATVSASTSFVVGPELQTEGPEAGQEALGGGCVALISSGVSGEESAFLDASESGSDAFFLTSGQLTASDKDGAFDIYDAATCTGCTPVATEGPVSPCTSGEECRPGALAPAVGGEALSSLGIVGGGNLAPHPTAAKRPKSNRQKLAAALARCHRDHRRTKRASCERQARKRYPVSKPRPSTKRKAK